MCSSQRMPRVYREHRLKFHAQAPTMRETSSGQSSRGRHLEPHTLAKSGFVFASEIHSILTKISTLLLGLLAGAALINTLLVNTLFRQLDGDTLMGIFGYITQPISIVYFILLTLIGVNLLDRCDIQDVTLNCAREAAAFQVSLSGLFGLFSYQICSMWMRIVDFLTWHR